MQVVSKSSHYQGPNENNSESWHDTHIPCVVSRPESSSIFLCMCMQGLGILVLRDQQNLQLFGPTHEPKKVQKCRPAEYKEAIDGSVL